MFLLQSFGKNLDYYAKFRRRERANFQIRCALCDFRFKTSLDFDHHLKGLCEQFRYKKTKLPEVSTLTVTLNTCNMLHYVRH